MYSQEDYVAVKRLLRKRWLITLVPVALCFGGACAVFVCYRLAHDTSGWIWSALLTILGGAILWFLYNTYIHPVAAYRTHLSYMLTGRHREAEGVLRELDESVSNKDGVLCRRLLLNVGDKGDPEDDRVFYWDVLLGDFPCAVGDRMRITSNDRMIANVQPL